MDVRVKPAHDPLDTPLNLLSMRLRGHNGLGRHSVIRK